MITDVQITKRLSDNVLNEFYGSMASDILCHQIKIFIESLVGGSSVEAHVLKCEPNNVKVTMNIDTEENLTLYILKWA